FERFCKRNDSTPSIPNNFTLKSLMNRRVISFVLSHPVKVLDSFFQSARIRAGGSISARFPERLRSGSGLPGSRGELIRARSDIRPQLTYWEMAPIYRLLNNTHPNH